MKPARLPDINGNIEYKTKNVLEEDVFCFCEARKKIFSGLCPGEF